MRQPLVAGNWKLNGSKQTSAQLIEHILAGLSGVSKAEVAVCPPALYIPQIAETIAATDLVLGSQNICEHDAGAYTGEISAPMLKEFAVKYAIIGHSERRSIYLETSELVGFKFTRAVKGGIIPILCVGEQLEERESGDTENVVAAQLDAVINAAGIEAFANAVIAYEPVWAIGTGKTATPEQAQDVHAFIRQRLQDHSADIASKIQILYGGSVKPDNAEELFAKPDIDGGLIGGASLDAESFLAICRAAN